MTVAPNVLIKRGFYLFIGLSLFLLPLLHAWQLYPLEIENFYTTYSALGGMLPWSDAEAYYSGANNLLENGTLDSWNTRRPLNAILFSIRLWLANDNFQTALMIQALLCGISCLLVTSSITKSFGRVASSMTFFVLFLFAATFIPTTLSETLGLTLGCLAFVLLWTATTEQQNSLIIFASGLLLMVGLNVRAGAFFVLPLLILWLGLRFHWRMARNFTIGVVCGLLFNLLLIKFYYPLPNDGMLHGNFAFTLFGLIAGGKGWSYAYTQYPQLMTQTESEVTKFLVLKSIEILKENPMLLFLGIFKGLGDSIKTIISFFQELPNHLFLKTSIRMLGLLALILGIWRLKRLYKIYTSEVGLIQIMLIGMLISACAIWTDGGVRVFAVTVPFFAAAIGVVVGSIFSFPKKFSDAPNKSYPWEVSVTLFLSLTLLTVGLLGPKFIYTKHSYSTTFSCLPNEIKIVAKDIVGSPQIPLSQKSDKFKRSIVRSRIEDKQPFLRILEDDILKGPTQLGLIYDLNSNGTKYLMGPPLMFSSQDRVLGICAKKIKGAEMVLWTNSYGVIDGK